MSAIPVPDAAPAIALPGDDDQLRRNGLPSYAKPGPYTTKLSPQDEQQFHAWVQQNNIPWRDTPNNDYDMRGFWKAQQGGDPNAKRATNLHFPDTWKTPYHESFSNESMYATPDAPHWNEDSLETTVPNAPAISLPNQSMPSLTSGAAIRPSATSMGGRGIPVTPQTGGKAIPINRATGQPEELNNEGKPIAPGVAGLWAKSENIHNPFLRGLAKIGSVAARAIDVAGSVAAPGIAAQIPGSTLNQKIGENRAEKQQTADTENTERQAVTAHTQAETAAEPTEVAYKQAQTDALNNKPDATGTTPDEVTLHDLMVGDNGRPRINQQTGRPYTYLEAYTAVKQAAQDVKPDDATDKTVRIIKGVPHEVLIDKKTGADIRDLGQTKLPGESADQKRSAAESVQVEREARTAVHKAEQDYNGALSTVQMQRQLIKDAKGGNKEAVRIVPLEGALQITTSQGVHRINRTEVEQYGQAGSLYDRIVGRIGGGVSGKSIPDDVLNDMDAMTQELAQNARQRYQREYNYNKQVVEGYGGKDFDKRVPMVSEQGEGAKGPAVGTVEGGYRFKGGNPADKANWEKQ